jgi:hypothetical protein
MAYPQELYVTGGGLVRTSANFDTAEVLTAAAAVYGSYMAHYPLVVQRFSFHVSTAISDLTASVVELQKVTLADVTSSITTLTVPNGTAVGKVLYKDCTPVIIAAGEKLQMKHLTQGGLGGTPAGAGFYGFLAALEPEVPGNLSNMIASA